MKIAIEIDRCSKCPHFESSPYWTPDSWERPEYWWCKACDAEAPNAEAEETRLKLKETLKLPELRYIAGYVEWYDKTPIPEWCPAKIEENGKSQET